MVTLFPFFFIIFCAFPFSHRAICGDIFSLAQTCRAAPVATKIEKRERHPDRKKILTEADTNFLACLWKAFGNEPFERGNLDAGRLGTLFMREVIPADDDFDPQDYEAMLMINEPVARASFPESFEEDNYR